jgi:hypothetical protein
VICRWRRRAAATAIATIAAVGAAYADGGTVRLSTVVGPFELTLLTAPTPLRVGPAELTVFVQAASSHTPLLDAEVTLRLRSPTGDALAIAAPRGAAVNQLVYAATVSLPSPGTWVIEIAVRRGADAATAGGTLEVTPPASPLVEFWPYFVAPAAIIGVFALHQYLLTRSTRYDPRR